MKHGAPTYKLEGMVTGDTLEVDTRRITGTLVSILHTTARTYAVVSITGVRGVFMVDLLHAATLYNKTKVHPRLAEVPNIKFRDLKTAEVAIKLGAKPREIV